MAVGGLVLSLSSDPALRQRALEWIRANPQLEPGPSHGARLAVVATTVSLAEGRNLCEALVEVPGVDALEVAFVAHEEGDDAPTVGEEA